MSKTLFENIVSETIDSKKLGVVITIPKTVKWEDYQKELDKVSDWTQEINFKVPNLPKNVKKGDRCYLCYNGYIIGWQTITNLGPKNFDCTTTGKEWEGNFISRSGPFNKLNKPIQCNGFRGFKYINYE